MTDFQATSRQQGDRFETLCNKILVEAGCTLHGHHLVRSVGVEIDQCASIDGQTVLIEYKGSENGKRPGLLRTDSMKKAICNGALIRDLKDDCPYWVITSHLPTAGASKAMMEAALRCGYVDRFMSVEQLRQAVANEQTVDTVEAS